MDEQRAVHVCHAITASLKKKKKKIMLVCGKCQFCFHFQRELCHCVYFNVMHVSMKTVRGILKSKFIAQQQFSGKGLCLWSHMCSSAGSTSSLAAAVFPLPRSAFQINEMLKCFPLYESKSLPTFSAGQKKLQHNHLH